MSSKINLQKSFRCRFAKDFFLIARYCRNGYIFAGSFVKSERSSMQRLIAIFLFCLALNYSVFSQTPFASDVDSLILRGIDYTFECEFDSAMDIFQSVVDQHPDHIVGYFYQAATLQSKMMDCETNLWEEMFYQKIDQAISVGQGQIEEAQDDSWTHFYLGNTYSYKGLYQAKTGGLISGFINARKGLNHLERSVELDSSLYDAYLSIGNFKYWEGRFYRFLKWLPWVSDERREGLRMIQQSISRGTFSRWVGMNSLAWIEFDRKRFEIALCLFREGLEQYPGSRFFLWGMAHTTFRMETYRESILYYQEILDSISSSGLNNGYNEAECRLKIGLCHFHLKEFDEAIINFDGVLNRSVDPKIAERLKKNYREAETYRKKSQKAVWDKQH
jgi:tetratricopeptide (TPR) repeat protein